MGEGKFYSGGYQRFIKEGGVPFENELEFDNQGGFDERARRYEQNQAATFMRGYNFGKAVELLLAEHQGDLSKLTSEVCSSFIIRNDPFNEYDAALVKAVATEIVRGEIRKKKKLS